VEIPHGICQAILTEYLGMRCVSTKCIPWLLTQEQKENYLCLMSVASDLLDMQKGMKIS